MKIRLDDVDGSALPEGCFIAVRANGIVKCGAHDNQQIYKFADPRCPESAQIDIYEVVYQHIGLCNIPVQPDALSVHEVTVKTIDSSKAVMKLKVHADSRQSETETADRPAKIQERVYSDQFVHEQFNVEETEWLTQFKAGLDDRCASTSKLAAVWEAASGDDSSVEHRTPGDLIKSSTLDWTKQTSDWTGMEVDYQPDAVSTRDTLHTHGLSQQNSGESVDLDPCGSRKPSKQSLGVQSQLSRDGGKERFSFSSENGSSVWDSARSDGSKTMVKKRRILQQPAAWSHDAETEWSRQVPDSRPSSSRAAMEIQMMKEKVHQAIHQPPYNVMNYYKKTGIWQLIARSSWFECLTLLVITCNAVWIAVDTDLNKADMLVNADWGFQLIENLFCAYYSFEWLVRYMSFWDRSDCLRSYWFLFDSCLLVLMVLETWILFPLVVVGWNGFNSVTTGSSWVVFAVSGFRLLRLCRLARITRLCALLPELVILVKGMIVSTRSVATTLLLLLVCLYVFGITFTQLCKNTTVGTERFPNVFQSMYRLLLYGVLCLDYVEDNARSLADVHVLLAAFYFVFILLASFTVMNMLIGVLVQVVTRTSRDEKEKLSESLIRDKMLEILNRLDQNGDESISKYEFVRLIECPNACFELSELGIDVITMLENADVIFEGFDPSQDIQITFEDFIEIVLQLRGDTVSTVRDVVELKRSFSLVGAETKLMVEQLAQKVDGLTATISSEKLKGKSQASHEKTSDIQQAVLKFDEHRRKTGGDLRGAIAPSHTSSVASDSPGLADEMRPLSRSASSSSVGDCSVIDELFEI